MKQLLFNNANAQNHKNFEKKDGFLTQNRLSKEGLNRIKGGTEEGGEDDDEDEGIIYP